MKIGITCFQKKKNPTTIQEVNARKQNLPCSTEHTKIKLKKEKAYTHFGMKNKQEKHIETNVTLINGSRNIGIMSFSGNK